MAGFREFVTGEVLTASNVDDFLAKQAVMKFADAAARDSALGTAVVSPNALREGMVAWLDDTDSVIAYDGSAWNPVGAEPPAGIGSNVVQTIKTDTFTTTSATFADVTGLTVTITPSSDTSRVLLVATLAIGLNASSDGMWRFAGGNSSTFVGDAAGSRTRSVGMFRSASNDLELTQFFYGGSFVDSPATASAVTYSVQIIRTGGTIHVNRAGLDTESNSRGRTASSLTAIEVAA